MDTDTSCHNIAISCAKMFVEANAPEYKAEGYSKLVEDFTTKYVEAYQQAKNQIIDFKNPGMRTF